MTREVTPSQRDGFRFDFYFLLQFFL